MSKVKFVRCITAVLLACVLLGTLAACGDANPGASTPVKSEGPSGSKHIQEGRPSDSSGVSGEESAEPTATPEPTPEPVRELPPIDSVTAEASPLMYDFLNGCIDWHVPIPRDDKTLEIYIMWHASSPELIYVDQYVVQAGVTFPPTGQAIEQHVLSEEELGVFQKLVSDTPEDCLYTEGGWTLLNCKTPYERLENTGIDFWYATDYTQGNPRPFLEDGSGWPTEWLRREPYCSAILDSRGIDMNDPWWDTFQLYGEYEMVPGDHATDIGCPKLTCTGFEMFTFENNGISQPDVSWNEIRDDCNHVGYNIPGIYNAWDWEPDF